MTCAPFRVEESKVRLPRFPSRKACRALRADPAHPECSCHLYPERGHYVLGACGHAHGWDLARGDAVAQAKRLNEEAAAGAPGAGPGASQAEPPPPIPAIERLLDPQVQVFACRGFGEGDPL